jgi:hypothetical protein
MAKAAYRELTQASVAMEPMGWVREAFEDAANSLATCPDNETGWYVALRAAELGRGHYPIRVGNREVKSLGEAAELAGRTIPKSARIAAVRARIIGGVKAAQEALAVDPSYPPSQVALGKALLEAGDAEIACSRLQGVAQLDRVPGGLALLAEAKLASGDPVGALEAAARTAHADGLNSIEPTIPDRNRGIEMEEVKGLANLALRRFDRAARLLLAAAAEGSVKAHGTLRSADANHRHALDELVKEKNLPKEQRRLLQEVLEGRVSGSGHVRGWRTRARITQVSSKERCTAKVASWEIQNLTLKQTD